MFFFIFQNFKRKGLDKKLKLLSTTYDQEDLLYVSTIEHLTLPIFGTQWHPEKPGFEWSKSKYVNSVPHDQKSIDASNYIAKRFVEESKFLLFCDFLLSPLSNEVTIWSHKKHKH